MQFLRQGPYWVVYCQISAKAQDFPIIDLAEALGNLSEQRDGRSSRCKFTK